MRVSLFAKLTALAGLAALLTIAVFSWFVGQVFEDTVEHHHARLHPWANWMVQSVLKDPSGTTLRRLADDLNIQMRYEGIAGAFVTDESLPTFAQVVAIERRRHRWRDREDGDEHGEHRRRLPDGFSFVRGGGRGVFLRYEDADHRLLMDWRRGDARLWDVLPPLLTGLIGALLLIWTAAYFLIRYQLLPLHQLREDMQAVGRGQWRVSEIKRRDEVGQLADGFNEMQGQLRANIAARERFLIDASHELRSPIARLKLLAEFVSDEPTRQKISANLSELESLTTDILQNARLRSDNAGLAKQNIAVGAWLNELIAARDATQQRRITVAAVLPSVNISGDKPALTRTVNNILDNALRYAQQVWVTAEVSDAEICIIIEDNGIGVADTDLPRLFEPFYRADAARTRDSGGFGLGLAIVAATLQAHNGKATAHHRADASGLQIRLTLPLRKLTPPW